MTGFRYTKAHKPKPVLDIRRPLPRPADAENMTGFINGIPADSQAEERFFNYASRARGVYGVMYKLEDLVAPRGMPGWKQLDFLVQMRSGEYRAFQLGDMSFIHEGQRAGSIDFMNDILIQKGLRNQGVEVSKIEWINSADLDTNDLAEITVKELFE